MSRTALLEQLYDIYNRAAFDEGAALLPEDFVYHPPRESPHPEPLEGRDAFRRFLEPDLFSKQWVTLRSLEERGDCLLAGLVAGGITVSGARLEQPAWQVWRFEGDVPREAWAFFTRADAERAAGLR